MLGTRKRKASVHERNAEGLTALPIRNAEEVSCHGLPTSEKSSWTNCLRGFKFSRFTSRAAILPQSEGARQQAETRTEAEETARVPAGERAGIEMKARQEAEARIEAERRARIQAEARVDIEMKAKQEAEARIETEKMARIQAEARAEAEIKARQGAEARIVAEKRARIQAEARADLIESRVSAQRKAKAIQEAEVLAGRDTRVRLSAESYRRLVHAITTLEVQGKAQVWKIRAHASVAQKVESLLLDTSNTPSSRTSYWSTISKDSGYQLSFEETLEPDEFSPQSTPYRRFYSSYQSSKNST